MVGGLKEISIISLVKVYVHIYFHILCAAQNTNVQYMEMYNRVVHNRSTDNFFIFQDIFYK